MFRIQRKQRQSVFSVPSGGGGGTRHSSSSGPGAPRGNHFEIIIRIQLGLVKGLVEGGQDRTGLFLHSAFLRRFHVLICPHWHLCQPPRTFTQGPVILHLFFFFFFYPFPARGETHRVPRLTLWALSSPCLGQLTIPAV